MSSSEITKLPSGNSIESKKPWQTPEIVDQSIAMTTSGNPKSTTPPEETGPITGGGTS